MSDHKVHFSSENQMWGTPQLFFDELNKKYKFTLDACASEDSAKCPVFYTKEDSCLDKTSIGSVFMNPPYGRNIGVFIKKAYEESTKVANVVCLLPARTDTKWFHDYCKKGKIEFIKGRLTFGTDDYWKFVWEQEFINGKKNSLYKKFGKKNPAPFPSMLVIFDSKYVKL